MSGGPGRGAKRKGGDGELFAGEYVHATAEGSVATIAMNRPDRLNVFSVPALHDLSTALDIVALDERINVVLFRSSTTKVFSGGADIKTMAGHDPEQARAFSRIGHTIALKLERSVPPVIMVCRGGILGGGLEFALACDMRVASEDAFFSQPEIDLGVIPGWGGTQRLARIIGLTRAREMIYTGRRITAAEALDCGLVNLVAPPDEVDKAATDLADVVASKGRLALLAAKSAINATLDTALVEGIDLEVEHWSALFATKDQKEGMNAFLEKRKPKFKGR